MASWIALLVAITDLVRKLATLWSSRRASEQSQQQNTANTKAAAYDRLLKALKAKRKTGIEVNHRVEDIGNITDSSFLDRLPKQRYRRD
jgi:hypothetical protein